MGKQHRGSVQNGLNNIGLEAAVDAVAAAECLGLTPKERAGLCRYLATYLSRRAKAKANEEDGVGYPYKV